MGNGWWVVKGQAEGRLHCEMKSELYEWYERVRSMMHAAKLVKGLGRNKCASQISK